MGRRNRKQQHLAPAKEITTPQASATNFKLIIPRDVMDKINWWIWKADLEVSGFGSLDYDAKENTYTVRDAILLKQEVGRASAEIDPVSLGKAMFRMKDEPNALKWHWHSHVNMGVFWSNDDMEIIRSLGSQGWIFASVFNRKEEVKSAFFTRTEVMGKAHDLFVNDVPTIIQALHPHELYSAWDKEYDENVTVEKEWTSPMTPASTSLSTKASTTTSNVFLGNYDDQGWGEVKNCPSRREIYNPCFDKDLKSEHQQFVAIGELTQEECNFLREHSPNFAALYAKYIKREREINQELFDEELRAEMESEMEEGGVYDATHAGWRGDMYMGDYQ